MATGNNANIGFEKQIWDAACVLWGHIPAAEYRKVIVGLIFLRYISSAFEKRYQELVAEGDGFEDDRDASAQIPKQTACRSIPSENPESSGTTSCPTVWMSFRPETGSRLFAFSSAAESPKTPLSTCSADHNFTECLHEKMLF